MKFAIPPAKNVLLPLGITATASVADAIILKKFHRSGTATLVIGNKELEHIIKIIKSLEDLGVLIKGVTKTIANGFVGVVLGTLVASLIGNILAGKGVVLAGEGTMRVERNFWRCFILKPILKCKNITKMNLDLVVFIQKIICQIIYSIGHM